MKLPFSISPKSEITKVGREDIGEFYLKKINGRTAGERVQLDTVDLEESKSQLALLKLANKVSQFEEISLDEALLLILTADTSNPILVNYLEEVEELLTLRTKAANIPNLVAYTLLKNRVAYPIKVLSVSESNLTVEPLSFPLNPGSNVKFPSANVTVLDLSDVGSETVELNAKYSIKPGEVGFLWDVEKSDYYFGSDELELEMIDQIHTDLVDEIYTFYQTETAGGENKNSKKSQQKKQSKSLKSSVPDQNQIGEEFISNVNPTPSENYTDQVLETPQIG